MIEEFYLLLPHILLSISIILWLVVDGLWKNKALNFWGSCMSLLLTFCSVFVSLNYIPVHVQLDFARLWTKVMLSFDGISYYFDLIFISSGIFTIITSRNYQREKYIELNEFYTLILIAVFGMLIISHSTNFLTLFLGIETMSLSFYVLAGFFRKSFQSVEAGIKYFLLGAFATGFLVYGIAFIYGATKSLNFVDISVLIQKA
ncbi:MAG: proton-conducting transporter membrane subunit, partial [Candidatus Kapaibacteriota bacterium]